jgi:hypothetical protein
MPPKKKQEGGSETQQGGQAVEALVTPFALLLGKQFLEFYVQNDQQAQKDQQTQTNIEKYAPPKPSYSTRAPVRGGRSKKGGSPQASGNPNQQVSEGAYLAQGGQSQGSSGSKKQTQAQAPKSKGGRKSTTATKNKNSA